jgi:hypothetical protein
MSDISFLINKGFDDPLSEEQEDSNSSTKNSTAYDKASYEAEGIGSITLSGRFPFFSNPKDPSLWSQVEEESRQAYPPNGNKSFSIFLYKKRGGSWGF